MGDSRVPNRSLEARECHYEGGNQIFMITGDNEIREKKFCLDATVPGEPVKLLDCHGLGGNQKWTHDESVSDTNAFRRKKSGFSCWFISSIHFYLINDFQTNQIRHNDGINCLTLPDSESDVLTIESCDAYRYKQQWHLASPSSQRYLF